MNFGMKKILTWALLISLLRVMLACEEEPVNPTDDTPVEEAPDNVTPPITSLSECEWLLLDYKYQHLPADLKKKSVIKFSKSVDGTFYLASGISFLNQYSGVFTLDERNNLVLSVHDLISTAMGGPDEQMAAEKFYFKKLYSTKSYGLAGNVLTLYFDNGEVGFFVPNR
jgi:heat shock protein HslJ